MVLLSPEERQALLENSLDSLRHALDHFFELAAVDRGRGTAHLELRHHTKQAILSAHHAGDCLLQVILWDIDPASPCFSKKGRFHHPPLTNTLAALRRPANQERLRKSEGLFMRFMEGLNEERGALMHRTLSDAIEPSIAACAVLAIRRVLRTRYRVDPSRFGWDTDDIGQEVMSEIRWNHYDRYFRYVEQAVAEESPRQTVDECPYCGSAAVLSTGTSCEACYLEVERVECPSCGCEFIAEPVSAGSKRDTCPNCGGVCP